MTPTAWRALAAAVLLAGAPARADAPRYALDVGAGPLVGCLEAVAAAAGVRIVDASARVVAHRCAPLSGRYTLAAALERVLRPAGLAWRRRADGTIEVVARAAGAPLDLDPLLVEGDPPAPAERAGATGFAPSPVAERALAVTRLGKPWLETAPIVGFDQIGHYAPNVYSAGQSLSIRGIERDADFFTALRFTYDGIDLGSRLIDDDLVPLDQLVRLELVRGPRSFEEGAGAFGGGVRLETDAPTLDPSLRVAGGVGDADDWRAAVAASGPLGVDGLYGTLGVARQTSPTFVEQRRVPASTRDNPIRDALRLKLTYEPDAVPGLSAQLAGLALSGETAERALVPSADPAFDPFDRASFAPNPLVSATHARGAALRARYRASERATLSAHASVTTLRRDDRPGGTAPFTTRYGELRQRYAVQYRQRLGARSTFVADVAHTRDATSPQNVFAQPFRPRRDGTPLRTVPDVQLLQVRGVAFDDVATTALAWLEHRPAAAWTVGYGLRFAHARTVNRQTASNELSGECCVRDAADRDAGPCTRYLTQPDLVALRPTQRQDVALPLATVEWRMTDAQSLTLSRTHGYRGGGARPGGFDYDAERSRHAELVWRAAWLDGRLRTQASVFETRMRNRYTFDGQFDRGPFGRARSRGVEFEADARLGERWRVRTGVGLLDAKYVEYDYGGGAELGGEPLAGAPARTFTAGARWGDAAGWYAALDAYHAGATESGIYNSPFERRPAYTVVDARGGYRARAWDVALLVANAFDEDYVVRSEVPLGARPTATRYRLGDPRRVELRFAYTFD